ncbi:MAG TPA: hypothetical protein VLA33_08460 [Gemmatimonadota bacterium]|nr:hypothetical protein [Gemmatimonadota bacterium]
MHNRTRIITSFAALGALVACSGDAPPGSDATVRDSAGVQIVENSTDGLWAAEGGWTTEELLTIGDAAGDADYKFGQIAGVDVLSDGRIAVLDQQAQRVQIYGPDGAYRQSFGGPGNGPGEFSPGAMALFVGRGDTIVVPDMGNQRVTVIPTEGEATSFPLSMEQGIPMGFDIFDGGALVSQRRAMNFADPTARTDDDLVLAQAYDGAILDTLLTPRRGGTFEMTSSGPRLTLFAAEPQWATLSDERLAYASNDAYRISVYGPEGDLERIVTFPHEVQPVTETEQEILLELVRTSMERNGAPPQAIDQFLGSMGFADAWPAFARLRGGPFGTLWVQRLRDITEMSDEERENWNPQLDQGGRTWDVFESDGRYGGVVELPARFTPFAIEEDRIYGVFRDDFDVQFVRVYALDTGPEPGDT